MSRAVARNLAEGRDASEITAVDPYGHPALADLPHVTLRRAGGLELDLELDPLHRSHPGWRPACPVHDIYLPYRG
jgi:hypothetical protein